IRQSVPSYRLSVTTLFRSRTFVLGAVACSASTSAREFDRTSDSPAGGEGYGASAGGPTHAPNAPDPSRTAPSTTQSGAPAVGGTSALGTSGSSAGGSATGSSSLGGPSHDAPASAGGTS